MICMSCETDIDLIIGPDNRCGATDSSVFIHSKLVLLQIGSEYIIIMNIIYTL